MLTETMTEAEVLNDIKRNRLIFTAAQTRTEKEKSKGKDQHRRYYRLVGFFGDSYGICHCDSLLLERVKAAFRADNHHDSAARDNDC